MLTLNTRRCPTSLLVLSVFLFFFSLACLYGSRNFYRDPGSIFFRQDRAFEKHYSTYRENEAHDYVSRNEARQALGQNASAQRAGSHPRLCMSIATAARDLSDPSLGKDGAAEARHADTAYLELAIGSVLAGLTRSEREDVSLHILFANTKPETHPSYKLPWISYVTDSVFTSKDTVPAGKMAELARFEREKKWHEKATNDYITALNRCYHSTTAPYIVVLEGDVLVADGWLARTLLSLRKLESRMKASSRGDAWLDLRLFNQERSTGFESHDWTGNNVPTIVSLASVGTCGLLLLLRRYGRKAGTWLDNATIAVICMAVIPATVVLFFQSGKASVLPRSPGVYEEGFGCCSQGLVFNRAHVPELTKYLQQHVSSEGYDMMTRDFGREMGLTRWAQYPMLMQHLGFHSILSWDRPVDQIVWSMAFEDLDPRRRVADHEKSVRELYGDEAWHQESG